MDDDLKENATDEAKQEKSIPGVEIRLNENILKGRVADAADAIVLSASSSIKHPVGSGLDHEVYDMAGVEELIKARNKAIAGKRELEPGDIFVTGAEKLESEKFLFHKIIHVIVPRYKKEYKTDRKDRNISFLESIIVNVFLRAKKEELKSLAFPLIGTGALGFKSRDVEETIKRAFLIVRKSDRTYFKDFTVYIYCMDTKPNKNVKKDYPQIDELLKMLDDSIEVPDFRRMNKRTIESWVKDEHLANSINELKEHGKLDGKLSAEKIQDYMLAEILRKVKNEEKNYHAENKLLKLIKKYMARMTVTDEKNNIKAMNDTRLLKKAGLGDGLIRKLEKSEIISIHRDSVIRLALALKLSESEAREFIRVGSATLDFPASEKEYYILQCIKGKIYDVKAIYAYCDKNFPEKSKAGQASDNKNKDAEDIEK